MYITYIYFHPPIFSTLAPNFYKWWGTAAGPPAWNSLPSALTSLTSGQFTRQLKTEMVLRSCISAAVTMLIIRLREIQTLLLNWMLCVCELGNEGGVSWELSLSTARLRQSADGHLSAADVIGDVVVVVSVGVCTWLWDGWRLWRQHSQVLLGRMWSTLSTGSQTVSRRYRYLLNTNYTLTLARCQSHTVRCRD